MFALIDGNSFYASCQIAFDPKLANRPVVVLSNNDGCVVAANSLAKNLSRYLPHPLSPGGYRMAKPTSIMFQPYFKIKPLLQKYQAAVFSSNYELYADMSRRMHQLIGQFSDRQEIYSIDESFLQLNGFKSLSLTDYGQNIRQTIFQGLGLPTAVGIAETKTLAKAANRLAKDLDAFQGVCDLSQFSAAEKDRLLKALPIGEIWGVGRKLSESLQQQKIVNALNLKQANPYWIKKQYGIGLEKTVRELNGEICFQLHQQPEAKQQIISSRSFGRPVTELDSLRQAVAHFTAIAARKLRAQNSACQMISVFITTDRFEANVYQNWYHLPLPEATDHSAFLIRCAHWALKQIWRPNLVYKKALVQLSQIQPKDTIQGNLFHSLPDYAQGEKAKALMQTLDQLNHRYGKHSLHFAAEGLSKQKPADWTMNRNLMSPRFTTRWSEILTVG